jgi:molybdopterin synthase catalytic subunit
MDINKLLKKIQNHPKYSQAGMVLTHIGIVRNTSLTGKKVSGIEIAVDYRKLTQIILEQKSKPGIVELLIDFNDKKVLSVGEKIMLLAIAGDTRKNVIKVLSETLDDIKTIATTKTEFFLKE